MPAPPARVPPDDRDEVRAAPRAGERPGPRSGRAPRRVEPVAGTSPAGLPAAPIRCHRARPRRILALSTRVAQPFRVVNDRWLPGSAMGRPQRRPGATLGALEEPGGGYEPCSPGQRGPFLHCGRPAITPGSVPPRSEPGAFRACRLSQPSRAGTARVPGFCARAGPATSEGALAPRRGRGPVRRGRLCGQARYPGRPAVGTGTETTGRGLVARRSGAAAGGLDTWLTSRIKARLAGDLRIPRSHPIRQAAAPRMVACRSRRTPADVTSPQPR